MEVKPVSNLLALLEFFAQRQRPATLAEIAEHFAWPRSSTHNLLMTLLGKGYLYEPLARKGYYPSNSWSTLLQGIEQAAPLPASLHKLLENLAARTQETAVLAGVSGADALFLDVVAEFGRGHGGAADAVAAGLGAEIDHRQADALGFGQEDLVRLQEAGGEGVDQTVAQRVR